MFVEVENHFDESGTHAGSPVLCLAGYIIEKETYGRLKDEWNAVLNWPELPKPLEYFRMSECAPDPGNGQFEGVSKDLRIKVETAMIEIIKRHTSMGLAVTIDEAEYDRLMPRGRVLTGSAYSFCAQIILGGVAHWIAGQPQVDEAAYFFEEGHDSQAETDWIMRTMFRNERAKQSMRYAGHGFVKKKGNPGVQAADLLAWQMFTDRKHTFGGRPRRRDLVSLLEHPHRVRHIDTRMIELIANRLAALTPETFLFGESPPEQPS